MNKDREAPRPCTFCKTPTVTTFDLTVMSLATNDRTIVHICEECADRIATARLMQYIGRRHKVIDGSAE